ncbi:MAG: hypothetical protein IJR66_04625 [Clostridia bacterium]|nr:hypothetical protein [Clostridia bacterium]
MKDIKKTDTQNIEEISEEELEEFNLPVIEEEKKPKRKKKAEHDLQVIDSDKDGEKNETPETALVFDETGHVDWFFKEGKKEEEIKTDFPELMELASLQNISYEDAKKECCLFEIRKIMKRIGKVVVKPNVGDDEIERILALQEKVSIKETLISPIYISTCYKICKKLNVFHNEVNAFIDFPLGEGSNKTKISAAIEVMNSHADGVCVMMSPIMLTAKHSKEFKKLIAKLGRICKKDGGIAFSVMELDDMQIKYLLRVIEKSKLSYITFIFGQVGEQELNDKMAVINKYRGKKTVKVMGNVDKADVVTELLKLNADVILTPYADKIGEELLKRFYK